MKRISVNGIDFEVNTPRNTSQNINRFFLSTAGRTLYNYYNKPSTTKIAIYDDWKRWADETQGITDFGVSSANCNFFSISFILHLDNNWYVARVTYAHRTLTKIN